MRKCDKMGFKKPYQWAKPGLGTRPVIVRHAINGEDVTFRVKYQNRGGSLPEKIIDVDAGRGTGPALNWTDAIAIARELQSCAAK